MQAAYDSGVNRAAPPDMPTRTIAMMPYVLTSGILVGIFIFLIIVLIGGMESNLSPVVQTIIVIPTLISIVTALGVSYYAFQRVVKGDAEATVRFPAWDRAMARWKSLYYCGRDNVAFDPQTDKVVSNEALAALRSMNEPEPALQSAIRA
jgi:hypothetical protein